MFAKSLKLNSIKDKTVTGAMPFAGGPLNSYVLHSTAKLIEKIREVFEKLPKDLQEYKSKVFSSLEVQLEKLKDPFNQSGLSEVDTDKISKTQSELDEKLKSIYSNLDNWQKTMVARHEDRPKSKFFIDNLFEDFISLSGDRF